MRQNPFGGLVDGSCLVDIDSIGAILGVGFVDVGRNPTTHSRPDNGGTQIFAG